MRSIRIIKRLVADCGQRVIHVGHLPICNFQRQRAPHIGRWCFPLCWRCSSILGGVLLGGYLNASSYKMATIHHAYALLLVLPTTLDGILQYRFKRESTNARRIWSGLLAGIGFALFI